MQLIFLPFSAHPHQWWEQCTAQVNFCDLGKHRIKKQEQERKKKESSQSSQKASEEVFLKGKLNNLEIFFISYFVYGSYFL